MAQDVDEDSAPTATSWRSGSPAHQNDNWRDNRRHDRPWRCCPKLTLHKPGAKEVEEATS